MARYPILVGVEGSDAIDDLRDHYEKAVAGDPFPASLTSHRGSGALLDETAVDRACSSVEAARKSKQWSTFKARSDADAFEAAVAKDFHSNMAPLDRVALGDPDFWRWVACAKMWEQTLWRYNWTAGKRIQARWFGLGESGLWRALPVSLFLRVEIASQAASVAAHTSLESLLKDIDSVGLWQDHLYAVQTGASPAVVAAFLRERQSGSLKGTSKSDAIKRVGRAINTLRSSNLSEALEETDGAGLVASAVSRAKVT